MVSAKVFLDSTPGSIMEEISVRVYLCHCLIQHHLAGCGCAPQQGELVKLVCD